MVFESILEKVLTKVVGEYISGIDSKNLNVGIWQGDVTIENVSLKQNIFEMLELPVQIRFSHINKLSMKIPWRNLSTSVVEVFLDGVYIIISPIHQNNWKFQDYRGMKKKLELIENYTKELLSKIQKIQEEKQKKPTKEKEQGMVDKILSRIIDNLQVTINSIHIRFESNQDYSWGITLDKIETYTVNEQGIKEFIDRTNEKNKDIPIRKILKLSKLGIYWNGKEQQFLALKNDEKFNKETMDNMIGREVPKPTQIEVQYLFSLSIQCNLIMNKKGNFQIPEIQIWIEVSEIRFKLTNIQLQQIVYQIEFISKYQKRLSEEKKNKLQITKEQKMECSNQFFQLFLKIQSQQNEKDKVITSLTKQEQKDYEQALLTLDYEDLFYQCKKAIIEIQKQNKIKDIQSQQKQQSKGFFSFFGSSSQNEEDTLINDKEIQQIDEFVSKNFSDEKLEVKNLLRPQDYVWFVLNFSLKCGEISLEKENRMSNNDQISFNYSELTGKVQMRDDNFELDLKLQSYGLDLITQYCQKQYSSKINMLRPNEFDKKQNCLQVKFEKKPLSYPNIDKSIDVEMQSARIEFNPKLIQNITSFFQIKFTDEELTENAKERLQETIAQTQNQLKGNLQSSTLMRLNVVLNSPVIILPFKCDGNPQNEVWVMHLGTLKVLSNDDKLNQQPNTRNQTVDEYSISLSDINMEYYRSLEFFSECQKHGRGSQFIEQSLEKSQNKEPIKIYDLIENFSINLKLGTLKSNAKGTIDLPNVTIEGELPSLSIALNHEIYCKLLNIGVAFAVPDAEEEITTRTVSMNDIKEDRVKLMKSADKAGVLYTQIGTIQQWEKFTGVLSGGYFYFFKNSKDEQAYAYKWVKRSEIKILEQKDSEMKYAIHVKNKFDDFKLGFSSEKQMNDWLTLLKSKNSKVVNDTTQKSSMSSLDIEVNKSEDLDLQLISEFVASNSPVNKREESKKNIENYKEKQIFVNFTITQVNLKLFNEEKQQQAFLHFATHQLKLELQTYPANMDCQVKLGGMLLTDTVYDYKDKELNNFITSTPSGQESVDLIVINLKKIDANHPLYNNQDLIVDVKLGYLCINYKADTLLQVLKLISVPQQEQPNEKILQKVLEQEKLEKEENKIEQSPQSENQSSFDSPISKRNQELSTTQSFSMSTNKDKIDTEKILLEANISLKQIKLVLVNRRTHLPQGEISIQNVAVNFRKKQFETNIEGSLGNFQLLDLTNYPDTLYDEKDWQKIKKNEILGLLKNEHTNSLITFKILTLGQNSHKINKDNITTYIDAKLQSIHIQFMMQPVMRTLDFLLVQVLGPLSDPDKFSTNEMKLTNISEKMFAQKNDPFEDLKKFSRIELLNRIEKPQQMSLNVVVENPIIVVKPNPSSVDYLIVDLGKIVVTNKSDQAEDRLLDEKGESGLKSLNQNNFIIRLQDMVFKQVRDGIEFELSKLFHFNVMISMLSNELEYRYLYSRIKLDSTLRIKCYVSPIIITMSNSDYNKIMKCLFHNISYNDGCDKYMVHDFEEKQIEQSQLFSHQLKEEFKQQQKGKYKMSKNISAEEVSFFKYYQEGISGVDFQLDMENLSLLATNNSDNIPFARATINDLRVQFLNDGQTSHINVYARDIEGTYFKKKKSEELYEEGGFLNKLNIHNTYSVEEMQDAWKLVQSVQEKSNQGEDFIGFHFPQFPSTIGLFNRYQEGDIGLQLALQMEMDQQSKSLGILVSNFQVGIQVSTILKLSNFSQTTQDTQSPNPKIPIEQQGLITKERVKQILQEHYKIKQQVIGIKDKQTEQKKQIENTNLIEKNLEQPNAFTADNNVPLLQQTGMRMNIIVDNIILCTPCVKGQQVLAIRSEFNINIQFFDPKAMQEIIEEIQQNKIKFEDSGQSNRLSQFQIEMKDFCLFLCRDSELETKQFLDVRKRELLSPMNVNLKIEQCRPLNQTMTTFINKQSIAGNITPIKLQISSQDITLVTKTANVIMEELNAAKSPEKQPRGKGQLSSQSVSKSDSLSAYKLELDEIGDHQEKQDQIQLKDSEEIKKENLIKEISKEDTDSLFQNVITLNDLSLQVIVINNLGTIFTPVLELNASVLGPSIQQSNILSTISGSVKIVLDYYNPQVSKWEPVLEELVLELEIAQSSLSETLRSAIECTISQQLNITFSTQFVRVLLQMISLIKVEIEEPQQVEGKEDEQLKLPQMQFDSQNFQPLQQQLGLQKGKEEGDVMRLASVKPSEISFEKHKFLQSMRFSKANLFVISSYTVINRCGYPIKIFSAAQGQDFQEISPNEQVNLKIDLSDNQESFNQQIGNSNDSNMQSSFSKRVNVEIIHPLFMNAPIQGINLNKIKLTEHKVAAYQVISEVVLDLQSNKKTLVISSPILMVNATKRQLFLQFTKNGAGQISESNQIKFNFPKGQSIAIPLDFTKELLQIGCKDSNGILEEEEKTIVTYTPHIKISELLNNLNGSQEVEVGQGQYYIINISKNSQLQSVYTLTIEPPYRFKNCLPKPLYVQIIKFQHNLNISKKLEQNEEYEEFNFSIKEKKLLRMSLPGFFWSKPQIFQENVKFAFAELSDIAGNKMRISLHIQKSGKGNQVYFLPKSQLLNETPYDLIIYTKNEKSSNTIHTVGGQREVQKNEPIKNNLVLMGEEAGTLLSLADKQTPELRSSDKPITGIGETEIDLPQSLSASNNNLGPDKAVRYITLSISIEPILVERQKLLFAQQYVLSPRYIIVNNTKQVLYVKQCEVPDTPQTIQEIHSLQRIPVAWHDLEKPKLITLSVMQEVEEEDDDEEEEEEEKDKLQDNKKEEKKKAKDKQIQPKSQQEDQFEEFQVNMNAFQAKGWCWSGALDIKNIGVQHFALSSNFQDNKKKFMKIDCRHQDSNIYIVIENVAQEKAPYKFINNVPQVNFFFKQLDLLIISSKTHPDQQLGQEKKSDNKKKKGKEIPYSWEFPSNFNKKFEVEAISKSENYENKLFKVTMDKIGSFVKIELHPSQKGAKKNMKTIYLKCTVSLQNETKIIKFDLSSLKEKRIYDEKQKAKSKNYFKSIKNDKNKNSANKEEEKNIEKENYPSKNINLTTENQSTKQAEGQDKSILASKKVEEKLVPIQEEKKQQQQSTSSQFNNEQSIDLNNQATSQLKATNSQVQPQEQKPQLILQRISIGIKQITISIIENHKQNSSPYELLNITIDNAEVLMQTKEKDSITQLRIQYINIDNNSNYLIQNPVIFTPKSQKIYKQIEPKQFFLNLLIDQNLSVKHLKLYNSFQFDIDPFVIRIDQQLITVIIDFIKGVFQIKSQIESTEKQLKLKENEESRYKALQKIPKQFFYWQIDELPKPNEPTFFDKIILSPIDILLTFQGKTEASDDDSLPLFKTIFMSIGAMLGNIDEAPIKLSGIKMNSCFDSINGITSKLIKHYKTQAVAQVLKLLGSLNIIGNPVGLFGNISSGVLDLFDKPKQGFIQGPLEGSLGILEGASSLVKNTVAGVFNSANKITGALSSGIALLTMDQNYLQQREKKKTVKPKNIIEGVEQGTLSIFYGIGQGLSGVFLRPYQETKKSGIKGFFKGTFQGLTGLIIKPVAGILDAASQTTSGIKNTITIFDEKPSELRVRGPRVFYGPEKSYKNINAFHSEMANVLQVLKKQKFSASAFLDAVPFFQKQETEKYRLVLITLFDYMILLSEKKMKQIWVISMGQLQDAISCKEGIKIVTNTDIKYFNKNTPRQYLIQIEDQTKSQEVMQQIQYALKLYQEDKKK